MLPGLLVVAELIVVPGESPARRRVEWLLPTFLMLGIVLLGFWTVRTMVGGLVGQDIHPAFHHGGPGLRLFTMLGVVPEWVRLLLVPLRLSADYSPQRIAIATDFGLDQVVGLLMLLTLLLLIWHTRRRAPVAAFGVVWVLVALLPVSNLLLPTGVLLAERTLFLPSVGAMLAVGGG